ncbi:lysozyme C-like [Anomaloglossus baeobatrachus]|uniref:lysozyme C-like n=1 Tax=Anomaloglossus baeobatrachus TaxID=238106 RepID=UPI003F504D01
MDENTAANLVCIAHHASGYNTNRTDGEYYGVFQIRAKEWCANEKYKSNRCNIPCSELLGQNLMDDVLCAIKIKRLYPYTAWAVWAPHCQNKDLLGYLKY